MPGEHDPTFLIRPNAGVKIGVCAGFTLNERAVDSCLAQKITNILDQIDIRCPTDGFERDQAL